MSDRNSIELSRRRVLGGLGAVGVASAGAALGTSAYFSDEESFDDNVLTAGSLDLLVDYYSYWDQGMAGSGSVSGTANGEAVSAELSDVKPGDGGIVAFCPRIETNPAYLWLCGELTADDENGQTEPEAEVDETTGEWNGELAESVQVAVSYCEIADDVGEDFDPEDLESSVTVWEGTLAEFLLASHTGLALDGDAPEPGVGFPEPGNQACFAGTDDEAENHCVCLDWWVPTDVGNEIQTDTLAFDLTFYAEQCRHNDGTANPCIDETFTSNEVYVHRTSDLGFGNEQVAVSDINAASESGATDLEPIVVQASYGEQLVVYRVHPTLGMEDPSNMGFAFDPGADGGAWDAQVLWESGGAEFTYLENGGISDDPENVPGVWASFDDVANVFTIAVERDALAAGGNDYRFAMQSIHEPGASNNPLNPSGSNARVDAELPSGFGWGDTATWQDATLP